MFPNFHVRVNWRVNAAALLLHPGINRFLSSRSIKRVRQSRETLKFFKGIFEKTKDLRKKSLSLSLSLSLSSRRIKKKTLESKLSLTARPWIFFKREPKMRNLKIPRKILGVLSTCVNRYSNRGVACVAKRLFPRQS